jgi:hypothetical protein
MRSAVVAVLLLLSSTALAQPSLVDPEGRQTTAPTPAGEATATMLSAGGAVAGVALIYLGSKMHEGGDTPIMEVGGAIALIGPSSGEWYAHGRAYITPGLGIRLAGVAMMGLGFGAAIDHACNGGTCAAPIRNDTSDALVGIGAGVVVAGMVWDIATAGHEAHRANARRFAIDPLVMPTTHGTTAGIGMSGAF